MKVYNINVSSNYWKEKNKTAVIITNGIVELDDLLVEEITQVKIKIFKIIRVLNEIKNPNKQIVNVVYKGELVESDYNEYKGGNLNVIKKVLG